MQVYDPLETGLPAVGLMKMVDAETKRETWIDTSSRHTRSTYSRWCEKQEHYRIQAFTRSRVDNISIRTNEDYVKALLALFRKRN
jgi:hypothetical protein